MTPIDPNAYAYCMYGHVPAGTLTVRAELAARAMQGLVSHYAIGGIEEVRLVTQSRIVTASVAMADALIAALNKPTS